jgi:hypothetical protein
MKSLFALLTMIALGVAIALGIDWVLWKAYIYVATSLFPTAPETITQPGFWVFAIAVFLIGTTGRLLFRGK